jgi:hypothetical protein
MKKKIVRIFFIFILIFALLGIAHYFIFPQETNCMLIGFSGFSKKENIYYSPNSISKLDTLFQMKALAEKRNQFFWRDDNFLSYSIIYCNTEKDFNKYGNKGAPATTQLKLGAYVVLQQQSLDLDIIAHEISHTVLYNNIGWYKTIYKIPTWFNEGLAMQVDDRSYYSIDTLMLKREAGIKLPDVIRMKRPADFFAGNNKTVMLNYSTAKYIVHEWLKTHSLQKFIKAINEGESFDKAYTSL